MAPILQVDDLNVRYGAAPAISHLSFEVQPGEVVAVVGESGSGKSTLALTLMGLLDRTHRSGTAWLNVAGDDPVDLILAPERRMCDIRGQRMAMIFQEPMSSLNPITRIGKQIAEAMTLHDEVPADEFHRRSVELLEEIGIADPERCLRAYPHQLSGGQCQRVGIAIALANNPSLLIADEPTTALDVTVQAQILRCLSSLRRKNNIAMLFITHDLGLVRRFADRVLVMYAGELVESGPVADVFGRPAMPYTAALLASRPRFDDDGRPIALEPIRGVFGGIGSIPQGCNFYPRCRHAQPPRCSAQHPDLEAVAPDHRVRCLRWQEVR